MCQLLFPNVRRAFRCATATFKSEVTLLLLEQEKNIPLGPACCRGVFKKDLWVLGASVFFLSSPSAGGEA